MIHLLTVLAQAETTTQPARPSGWGGIFSNPLVPLILVIVVFYFIMFRGRRGEQKKRDQMLANIRKNDHVVTIGGVIGTVVAVRDQEVTVKIDEASNTKINVARWAIKTVIIPQDT